ncbi:MFS transporter, partial [Patescibacteria group bacterium]|nr:MFS transporter [Patescibacteria group bacterium]
INLIFYTLCLVELDVILESYSTDKKSGRIRGLHLTIMNTGFILGPLISTQLLRAYNFQAVFFAQFIIIFLAFIIAICNFRKVNHIFKPIISVSGLFKKILKRKNVIKIYCISLILEFFYFIMTVYMPIYLRSQGMDWKEIGIVFSFMLIPFVLLQYPTGFIADKKIGEKELIIASFLIMASATFSLYFIYSINIYVWAIILFITRIGASMLDVLRDSYFYKRIDGSDVDIIDFFKTSRPVGFIIASAISSILILFFPLKSVFILMAFIALSGLIPAFYLVDDKGEDEV